MSKTLGQVANENAELARLAEAHFNSTDEATAEETRRALANAIDAIERPAGWFRSIIGRMRWRNTASCRRQIEK